MQFYSNTFIGNSTEKIASDVGCCFSSRYLTALAVEISSLLSVEVFGDPSCG